MNHSVWDLSVQSSADLLAGLGTLSAVELKYEQVPGYAVPTLSKMAQLHARVFDLLGFQPSRHRRCASRQTAPAVHSPRHQPSHQRPVRNGPFSSMHAAGTRRNHLSN
jgi:hypothetical protein